MAFERGKMDKETQEYIEQRIGYFNAILEELIKQNTKLAKQVAQVYVDNFQRINSVLDGKTKPDNPHQVILENFKICLSKLAEIFTKHGKEADKKDPITFLNKKPNKNQDLRLLGFLLKEALDDTKLCLLLELHTLRGFDFLKFKTEHLTLPKQQFYMDLAALQAPDDLEKNDLFKYKK